MDSHCSVNSTVRLLNAMTVIRQCNIVTLLVITTILIGPCRVSAQEASQEPDIIKANAARCQQNTIYIANTGAIAQTTKDRMFVIARLGTGETSRRLNQRRLADIKTEYGDNFRGGKIILTEGPRVTGLGRVEFYLGSELNWITLLPRNGDFCSLCCDRKQVFYKSFPPRSHRKRRR